MSDSQIDQSQARALRVIALSGWLRAATASLLGAGQNQIGMRKMTNPRKEKSDMRTLNIKPYLAIILTLAWSIACVQAQFLNFTHVGGGATGSLTKNSDTSYTLVGGGNDIWDAGDEFDFGYVNAVGDFDVHVRVESLEAVATWTKAGIMVRESLFPESRMGFIRTTPNPGGANDLNFAYRTGIPGAGGNGGQHEDGSVAPNYPNAWIRLQRAGSVLTAYSSLDGATWEQRAQQDTATWAGGALPSQVLLGLAVSRHSGGDPFATAEFRDLGASALTLAPLSIVSARGTPGKPTELNVLFSEPVNEADAETLANYAVTGVTLSSAELQADGRTVKIACSALNAPGCRMLTVNNVRTAGGTPIAANSTAPVIHADRFVYLERYDGIDGSLNNLKTRLTGAPSSTAHIRTLDSVEMAGNCCENGANYGVRVRATLVPPVTGSYVFATSSDDGCEVYLSTNDDPASKVLIAREPEWAGYREFHSHGADDRGDVNANRGPKGAGMNISQARDLQAGCRYYIELLFAEGGGGDNFSVMWQLAGKAIANGQIPIESAYLTPYPLVLTLAPTQPADQNISANQPLDLAISITAGSQPLTIQWYKNGVAIPGATSTSLHVADNAAVSDTGNYHAVVENSAGRVQSRTARIEVVIDTVPPSVVSATAPAGVDTQFDLVFSEPVNKADAENLSNYSMAGATLSGAVLQADNKTVRFTTSSLYTPGCKVLTVNNIKDRAIPPNTLASAVVGVVAGKGSIRFERYNDITGAYVRDLTDHTKYVNTLADSVTLNTAFEGPDVHNAANPPPANHTHGDNYGAQFVGYVHPPLTGAYRFYIAADDHAALYLSTDDNPANKVLIAREPNWGNFREWTGMAQEQGGRPCCTPVGVPNPQCQNVSQLINLQGGCKYFVQLIYKEGGGGDYASVTWQLPGGPVPANGFGGTPPIQGTYLSPYEPAAAPPVVDNDPPQIAITAGSTTRDRISVTFNEPVDPAVAADYFSYVVTSAGGATVDLGAADLSADRKTVLLRLVTGALLDLDAQYTVTASGITDLHGNAADILIGTFHSVVEVAGCGGLLFEAYPGPGGYAGRHLCGMFEDPTFPNNPFRRQTMTEFSTVTQLGTTDFRNQYGARLRGIFVPPYTGDWVFYVHSDDSGELYLNPNGVDPAGAIHIAWQYRCCDDFPVISSADFKFNLIGGRPYYIQGNYKEDGGGDYIRVAAGIRGSTDPLVPITARDLGQFAEPGYSGAFGIAQQPTDQTVMENRVVTFSATAVSEFNLPICYQWFKNGSPITGANGQTYSLRATLADNGAVFTVRVALVGNVIMSAGATLNVLVDPDGPKVLSAKGADTLRNVFVNFDELVDPVTASDYYNYTITGLEVTAANLLANGTSVKLTTTEQTQGAVYTVNVTGVMDIAATPNAVGADNHANFTAFVFSPGFLKLDYFGDQSTADNALNNTLLLDPTYPDLPDQVHYMSAFDTRTVFPNDSREGYGARISGLFIPPTSGNWLFYMSSDDSSRLYLNTAGTDYAGKTLINEEVGCCGGWVKAGVSPSGPQALTAGGHYWIEAVYKEGTGGDYLKVAARLEGQPAPSDNPSGQQPVSVNAVPPGMIGVYTDPTTGASGRITQQLTDQTSCLDPFKPVQDPAVLTVGVQALPAGVPAYVQWQRWNGTAFADIPTVKGTSYTFTPTLADNGARFRAVLYVLGLPAPIYSDAMTLSVYQKNTPPQFNLGSSDSTVEDGPPRSVIGFASNVRVHSIPRSTSITFDAQPPSSDLYGWINNAPGPVARVANGVLHLTDAGQASASGSFALNLPSTQTFGTFEIAWKSYIGDGQNTGADGYSVNVADDIGGDPLYGGEEGKGSGLTVAVDTFENGSIDPWGDGGNNGGPEGGIELKWAGQILDYERVEKDNPGSGNYLRKSRFVDAKVTVDASGNVTYTYDGNTLTGQIPGYAGIRANRILFWARTGGANDNHWIDNITGSSWVDNFLVDSASAENGQHVTFEVSNNNPSLFSQQPAISPDGTLTYTPAPDASGQAIVTVVARDDGGTNCGGDDAADPKTFTITVACVNDCPVANNIGPIPASQGSSTPITLPATDADGNSLDPQCPGLLTCAITSLPSHGTLTVNGCNVTYTPAPGYLGPDSFTYTASDGICTSPRGTVTIQVIECPPPPCRMTVAPAECGVTFANSGKLYTIAVSGDEVCLILDGSGSGAGLTFTWTIDDTNVVSGAVVNSCLGMGCHKVVLTVRNNCGSVSRCEMEICVITPAESVEQLIALVESTPVERKNKRPLIVSLKAAKAAFDQASSEEDPAKRLEQGGQMLQVFQHKVRAQITRNNPAEAAMFDAAAGDVIKALECSLNLPPRSDEN
jgi:Big-like domain-containing protein/Ig-like domain-containing protein